MRTVRGRGEQEHAQADDAGGVQADDAAVFPHAQALEVGSIAYYDSRRTLAGQMARSHRLPGNQPPQTLQVHPRGAQHALLVEAQQEVDECR